MENTSPVTVRQVEDPPVPFCAFIMDDPNIRARIPPIIIQIKDKVASAIHSLHRSTEMNEIKRVIFTLVNIYGIFNILWNFTNFIKTNVYDCCFSLIDCFNDVCLVRLYLQLFVGGLMSYLHYLCLFVHSGVQHIVSCIYLFCLSSSYVASFSGLSIFDCPFIILYYNVN